METERIQFEGCGMKPRIVLVKFFGVNADMVVGIPEHTRNEEDIQKKREAEIAKLGIKGPETGFCVIRNEQWVKVSQLIEDLSALDYFVTEIRWFWQIKNDKKKRVLELVFSKEGNMIHVPDKVKNLFRETWSWLNIWANVREDEIGLFRLDTINLFGAIIGVKAQSVSIVDADDFFSYVV